MKVFFEHDVALANASKDHGGKHSCKENSRNAEKFPKEQIQDQIGSRASDIGGSSTFLFSLIDVL